MDVMLRGADAIADTVWLGGREDTQTVFDPMAAIVNESGGLAITFLGPLSLLFGMIGLVIVSAVLMMRSALLYLVAAFAPIVWASSVSPVMRGAGRRLMHVTVALVLAKPAIVLTLTVGMKLMANTLTDLQRRRRNQLGVGPRLVDDRVHMHHDGGAVAVGIRVGNLRARRLRWRLAERALSARDAGGLSNSGRRLEFVALL